MGTSSPTDADLRSLLVRKTRFLTAIQYLVHLKPLYGNVEVARFALDHRPINFIPSDLLLQILICNMYHLGTGG